MLNLLRSDFYRLFRSKSFYICIAIQVALFMLQAFALKWASDMSAEAGDVLQSMLPDGGIDFAMSVFSSNVSMILGIIIAIFVAAEFSHGTMKNTISKGFIKWKVYASKFVSMLTATYLVILISMIAGAIFGAVLFDGMGKFTSEYAKIIGIEALLYAALTAFFVFVSMVVRNLGGVLAINLLGTIVVEPLIYQLLQLICKGKIKFSDYSLINNIAFYNSSDLLSNSDYLRSAIVALAYLAVTVAAGIIIYHKSDIK